MSISTITLSFEDEGYVRILKINPRTNNLDIIEVCCGEVIYDEECFVSMKYDKTIFFKKDKVFADVYTMIIEIEDKSYSIRYLFLNNPYRYVFERDPVALVRGCDGCEREVEYLITVT